MEQVLAVPRGRQSLIADSVTLYNEYLRNEPYKPEVVLV